MPSFIAPRLGKIRPLFMQPAPEAENVKAKPYMTTLTSVAWKIYIIEV